MKATGSMSSPGDLIFHDSWQMHAMRTGAQPLLAFAGWIEVGDRRAIGWSDSVNRATSDVR